MRLDIGGWVAGADFYGLGASITVYAEAYEGYTFTNWTVAGAVVSTDPFYSFTVTGARSLVANFNPFPAVALTNGAPGSHALILSWPNADPGWVLQESTDLVEWVNSTRPVTIVGGQRTVPASATGACRYFRLVDP